MTDGPMDRRTNGPMNRRTDGRTPPLHRVTSMRLKSHIELPKGLVDEYLGVSKRLIHSGSKVSKTDATLGLLHSISLHPAPHCFNLLRSWAHLLVRKRQRTDKMRSTCINLRQIQIIVQWSVSSILKADENASLHGRMNITEQTHDIC